MSLFGSVLGGMGGGSFGEASVRITADTSQLTGDMSKAKGEVQSSAAGMGKSFATLKTVGVAAGIAVAAGLVKVGVAAVQAAAEAERVAAATDAVIKSTGGVAGVSAEHVAELAHNLQEVTGISDETIQAGENLGLTFTNVRNEGEGAAAIFDRMTTASADMAVAMNQGSLAGIDLKGTTMQLGKALNDPAVGMTALVRSGVSFTTAMKNQIATLQEHGHLLKAQKIILGEVEREFGGAAKAAGGTFEGALAKLNNQWDDMLENIGHSLIPMLKEAVQFIGELVTGFDELVNHTAQAAEQKSHEDQIMAMAKAAKVARGPMSSLRNEMHNLFAEWMKQGDVAQKTGAMLAKTGQAYQKGKISAAAFLNVLSGMNIKGDLATKVMEQYAPTVSGAGKAMDAAKKDADGFSGALKKIPKTTTANVLLRGVDSAVTNGLTAFGNALSDLAGTYPVNINVNKTGAGGIAGLASGGIAAAAHGMIARTPTLLVGEGQYNTFAGRGAEAVIPLNDKGISILGKALQMAGATGGIHFHGPVYGGDGFEERVELALRRMQMRATAA